MGLLGGAEKARAPFGPAPSRRRRARKTVVYWMFGPFPGPTPRPVASLHTSPDPGCTWCVIQRRLGRVGPLDRSVQCLTGRQVTQTPPPAASTPKPCRGCRAVRRKGSGRRTVGQANAPVIGTPVESPCPSLIRNRIDISSTMDNLIRILSDVINKQASFDQYRNARRSVRF